MNCGCEYTDFPLYRHTKPYSRFDHSVGVALITWHFTQSPRQTVAGLLHDIATPVFAHVVDFLNGDHLNQESTEAGTEDLLRRCSALLALLERDGVAVEDAADYHRFPLADNPSPRLSADRLEYTPVALRLSAPGPTGGLLRRPDGGRRGDRRGGAGLPDPGDGGGLHPGFPGDLPGVCGR